MKEVKSINKFSIAKVMGVFYGIIGFITSIILAALVGGNIISQGGFLGSATAIMLFHLGSGVLLGLLSFIVTGAIGWVIGFFTGAIYNCLAKRVGGIRVEMVEVEKWEWNPNFKCQISN